MDMTDKTPDIEELDYDKKGSRERVLLPPHNPRRQANRNVY